MNKSFTWGYLLDILVYGLLAAFLAVLQTTLIPRIGIFNAFPDLVIGAICCIGIYREEEIAALFGLIAGLAVEALGSTGISVLPLFYMLMGYVCGRVGAGTRENAQISAFVITVPFICVARTVFSLLSHILHYLGTVDLMTLLLYTLLPELIYDLIVCIPVYLIVKFFELPVYIARKRGSLY